MRAVNLLPEQHRHARSGSGEGQAARVLLGVLAALVAMAAVYALTANQVNSRKSDSAAATQEAKELEARANALGPFGDFARVRQNRLASVRSLAGIRFDWERLMREVARVVPPGSWLTQANASVTGELTSDGGSSTPAASTGKAGQPAANFVGCAPRQSEVAKLMVRLRRLYRVTDVSLNESARESDGEAASVGTCGSHLKFDVTATFGSAPATGEGPGEDKRVPASLGGGS
jgi:Tfp pilus assembly protein PilN